MEATAGWPTATIRPQWQPKKIEAFAGQRVVAVSAGGAHSLAVTADGAVWSWGFGEALTGQRVLAVSAGQYHGMVITAGGAL